MSQLVSILIPAYNAAPWIGSAIRSAIDQTWPNVEIIVVDDGSTDQTLAVASSMAARNVKVITQANRGASAARNAAISHAQGRYIQWLDADDLLAPDKIERQMRIADGDASDLTLLSSSFAEFLTIPESGQFKPTVLWQDLTPVDFLLYKFTQNVWMNPAVWLVSRTLSDRAGLWDERLTLDDDGEYFARVVAESSAIRFVPDACMYYRRGNVGSLSRSVSDKACNSLLLSLQLCVRHLRAMEDSHRTRAASVRLLQNAIDLSDCFYPDTNDRLQQMRQLACELGGTLTPIRLSWKYVPIQAMFGWKGVKRARGAVSSAKLRALAQLETLSFALSNQFSLP